MYLLIEHAGTDEHIKTAQQIKDYAEENFGATCEDAVGYVDSITLYNEGLDKVAEFSGEPSDRDLHFYLAITNDEDIENG